MNAPDSALKLFLKYTPDALEHLFDKCISSYCETEQVQGKIFFDFFLFCPPFEQGLFRKQRCDSGELTLAQILIAHGKAYFLLHPLFETFIKVHIHFQIQLHVILIEFFFCSSKAIAPGNFSFSIFSSLHCTFPRWLDLDLLTMDHSKKAQQKQRISGGISYWPM